MSSKDDATERGHAGPIIVRKRVHGGHGGHHGGAWKVAYADFVTAMMAFFLLMWLLGATTEDQRKGIADYFASRVPISPEFGRRRRRAGGRLHAAHRGGQLSPRRP